VNGASQAVHCAACQADAPVPDGLWNWLFSNLDDAHDTMIDGDMKQIAPKIEGVVAYHCTYTRRLPRCDKCAATLPLDIPTNVERDVFCTACGDGASVYPAPEWLRSFFPNAQQITSIDRGAGPDAPRAVPLGAVTEAPKPIVMPCPQCGGALQLGGDAERVTKCRYCTADVYLPDDLWKRLHPVRVVREWFVRFDGETDAQRRERVRRQKEMSAK